MAEKLAFTGVIVATPLKKMQAVYSVCKSPIRVVINMGGNIKVPAKYPN